MFFFYMEYTSIFLWSCVFIHIFTLLHLSVLILEAYDCLGAVKFISSYEMIEIIWDKLMKPLNEK